MQFQTNTSLASTPSPPPQQPIPLASFSSEATTADRTTARAAARPTNNAIPLSLPTDKDWLSPPVCLLRDQMEAFSATPRDIAERKAGIKPLEGAVGLRCRHCSHVPKKSGGAVAYPKSISLIHQAVRNFQRKHFYSCPEIPDDIKEEMKSFKKKELQSKRNSAQYWIQSSKDGLGLIDVNSGDNDEHEDASSRSTSSESNKAKKSKGGSHAHIRFRDGWFYSGDRNGVGTAQSSVTVKGREKAEVQPEKAMTGAQTFLQVEVEASSWKSPSASNNDTTRKRTNSEDSSVMSLSGLDGMDEFISDDVDTLLEDCSPLDETAIATATATENIEQVDNDAFTAGDDGTDGSGGVKVDNDRRSSLHVSMLRPANIDATSEEIGENSAKALLDILDADSASINDTNDNEKETQESLETNATAMFKSSQITAETTCASTSSVGTGLPLGADPPSFATMARMVRSQQLAMLQNILALVQTTKAAEPNPNLVEIGTITFRAFIGSDPPEDILSQGQGKESDGTFEETLEAFADTELATDENDVTTRSSTKRRRKPIQITTGQVGLGTTSIPGRLPVNGALQNADLPAQLVILIASLLTANDESCAERYQSIEEVEEDLLAMLADPDHHLFDIPLEHQTGRLEFPCDRLYGRELQQKQLQAPLNRVVIGGGPREAVYVSGVSGTGKSAIVELQLRCSLYPLCVRVIFGKFDALRQRQPVEVVCRALDDFCGALAAATDSSSQILRTSITDAINVEGVVVLSGLMPNLLSMVPNQSVRQVRRQSDGLDGVNQLFYYLNLFIAAIAGPATPVVFWLDDIQWADQAALDMVTRMLSERSLTSFLFIGCYREDEATQLHPMMKHRQDLTEAGVLTSNVALGDIQKEDVHDMLSDLLHLPKRITASLSDAVYSKTGGHLNPLLVKQFVSTLYDEGILQFSARARRWEWDIAAIRGKNVADNIAGLLTKKMISLDPRAKNLLKLASCFGSEVKASVLAKVDIMNGPESRAELMERDILMQILVNEGHVNKVDSGKVYRFSHDQVQQASYQLIPPLDRAGMHLRIGRELRQKVLCSEELNDVIFLIVDQFSRGIDLLQDHREEIEIARLCLMAGKKAMAKSSFVPASVYFLQGTALLRDTDWEHHYDLSLELFTCCVEAQYVTSNYDGVAISYFPITQHGRCIQDKLPAFRNVLSMLQAQGKVADAVDAGLYVLEQLGEPIKKDVTMADNGVELVTTMAMLQATALKWWAGRAITSGGAELRDTSVTKALFHAPIMQNKDKESALQLMNRLDRPALLTNQYLVGMLAFRAIRLSLTYGICEYSAEAFARYGVFLCCRRHQVEEGYRFGKLALDLVERYDSTSEYPKNCVLVYSYINCNVDPLQSLVPELRCGYDVAVRSGNIEHALMLGRRISLALLACTPDLKSASDELQGFVYKMQAHKDSIKGCTIPILQFIMILMGDDGEDSTQLSGKIMDQKEALKDARGDASSAFEIYIMRLRLTYLFGAYCEAGTLVKEVRTILENLPMKAYEGLMYGDIFFIGLTAAVMGQRRPPREANEWKAIAQDAAKQLNRISVHSEWNFQHKLALLNAEIAFCLRKDYRTATKCYKEAIDLARKHKFVGDHALALERAAVFCSTTNQDNQAQTYFEQAEAVYRNWGAKRKADAIAATLRNK